MTAYGQTNLKLDEQKGKEGKKFFKTTWRAQNHVKTQSRRVGWPLMPEKKNKASITTYAWPQKNKARITTYH